MVLIKQPGLRLPPDADVTVSPTLPLSPGAPTGTWPMIGSIFQGGERVSHDVLFFDIVDVE